MPNDYAFVSDSKFTSFFQIFDVWSMSAKTNQEYNAVNHYEMITNEIYSSFPSHFSLFSAYVPSSLHIQAISHYVSYISHYQLYLAFFHYVLPTSPSVYPPSPQTHTHEMRVLHNIISDTTRTKWIFVLWEFFDNLCSSDYMNPDVSTSYLRELPVLITDPWSNVFTNLYLDMFWMLDTDENV